MDTAKIGGVRALRAPALQLGTPTRNKLRDGGGTNEAEGVAAALGVSNGGRLGVAAGIVVTRGGGLGEGGTSRGEGET
jgi:hypothetical protein